MASRSVKIYDVFLSYYGLATRNNFVDDILHALGKKGISTRMEDISIVKGQFSYLPQPIFVSMEQSSMAVIVFCRDYVTNPICLNVLLKIMESSKAIEGGFFLLPVFYDIDPLDLRNSDWPFQEIHRKYLQFGERYEYSEESVKLWRQAIVELTNLQGLTTLKFKSMRNWMHNWYVTYSSTRFRFIPTNTTLMLEITNFLG